MTPPFLKEIEVDPETFAELQRSARGEPRAHFHTGATVKIVERGGPGELHVHLGSLTRAPEAGGRTSCGLVVLPVDIRWNLLHDLAQRELPFFRHHLYQLMKEVEAQVGDAFLLEQDG